MPRIARLDVLGGLYHIIIRGIESRSSSGWRLAGGKGVALEAVVGTEKRIRLVVQDLENHFGRRLETMDGKAPGRRRHNSSYRHRKWAHPLHN